MSTSIYADEHDLFRESFRQFVEAELVPNLDRWEAAGRVDREVWAKAGSLGYLGFAVPEEYGGAGINDFRFNAIMNEELAASGAGGTALGMTLHTDITTPYFLHYCNDEQKQRWLAGIASGELITAIAMTEPGTGSDLASIATTAKRDGDTYIVNGAKTFITNGLNADLVITVVRTNPDAGRDGLSLVVLERGMEGFERGKKIPKIGQHAQDTAELFFSDVVVPAENLLGEEGKGFSYLSFNLAQERLSIALYGLAAARAAIDWTVDYVNERQAFGQPIAAFQNTKFVLAEVATEVTVTESFINDCIIKHNAGELSAAEAAMAKLWCTELQNRVIDRCLQLFGGYGYTTEYPIGRAYADARVTTIYGGTSEVMKIIVAADVLKGSLPPPW